MSNLAASASERERAPRDNRPSDCAPSTLLQWLNKHDVWRSLYVAVFAHAAQSRRDWFALEHGAGANFDFYVAAALKRSSIARACAVNRRTMLVIDYRMFTSV